MPHTASPQGLVYLHTDDAPLRQALRLTKTAEEVWSETDAWKPRWDAIVLAAKQENIANGEAVSSVVPDDAASAAVRDAASAARHLEESVRGGILHLLEKKTLPWYRACAYRAVRTYISLAAEPQLATVLKSNIMNSPLKDIKGVHNRKCVVFLFDATTIGEAPHHAAWRFPTLDAGRVRKLVSSALGARNGGADTCVPIDGDVFLLFDGGRSSETTLMAPFKIGISDADTMVVSRKKAVDIDIRPITLAILENSVLARRVRHRGDFDLNQTPKMYVVTTKGLKVPQKTYPEYPNCTPKGDLIMPIQLPLHSDPTAFTVSPHDKAEIWGQFRATATVVTPAAASAAATTEASEKEPVCFHGMSKTFYNSVFDAFSVAGVCDLSVGGGAAAEAALGRKLPYYGICPTDHHAKAAFDWLASRTLAMMADPSSSFYDVEYAKLRVPVTTSSPAPQKIEPERKPRAEKNRTEKNPEDSLIMPGPLSLATVGCVCVLFRCLFACVLQGEGDEARAVFLVERRFVRLNRTRR